MPKIDRPHLAMTFSIFTRAKSNYFLIVLRVENVCYCTRSSEYVSKISQYVSNCRRQNTWRLL